MACLALLPAAQAGTKEELMRLQSDVLSLQNQIRESEKTYTERMDGLKSLVVQLNDQIAQSNQILGKVQASLEAQASGTRTTDQDLRQEIRALSTKIDDAAMRISAMAQQLNELKVQSKTLEPAASAGGSLSPDSMYNQAYSDFVQGNFDMAVQGFTAYVASYPGGEDAAKAILYIGEAHSSQNKLPQALASFTRVINDYPETASVPVALYKRARVELALQQREEAIADFKNILEKYPTSAEAAKAKAELQQLGALTPAAAPRRKTR